MYLFSALKSVIGASAFSLVWLACSTLPASPWSPVPNPVIPRPGTGLPSPTETTGKDFSDYRDRNALGVGEPERVIAWDGSGGTRDSFNYVLTRTAYPDVNFPMSVDAISNGGDALFQTLRDDRSALLFSVGDVGVGGPVADPTIYYVRPTFSGAVPGGHGVWATAPEIDDEFDPATGAQRIRDVDGLEVWGPDQLDDTNRYSLYGDPFTNFVAPNESHKVAIWEYDSVNHVSKHHTLTTHLAAAMDLQYFGFGEGGPLWGHLVELMDVDAMMTLGTRVTFSIAPLALSQFSQPGGPLLPDFDGGEIFEYDGPGIPTRFLEMGGYVWDTALDIMGTFGVPSENINALESIAVPEPNCLAMMLLGLFTHAWAMRRSRPC